MLIPAISSFVVLFQQTPPDNSLVCPGQKLVYSCTTVSTGALEWQTSGQAAVLFTTTTCNHDFKAIATDPFTFQLIDMDGAKLTSTATVEMADSSIDGMDIDCNDGNNNIILYVHVAGMYACVH